MRSWIEHGGLCVARVVVLEVFGGIAGLRAGGGRSRNDAYGLTGRSWRGWRTRSGPAAKRPDRGGSRQAGKGQGSPEARCQLIGVRCGAAVRGRTHLAVREPSVESRCASAVGRRLCGAAACRVRCSPEPAPFRVATFAVAAHTPRRSGCGAGRSRSVPHADDPPRGRLAVSTAWREDRTVDIRSCGANRVAARQACRRRIYAADGDRNLAWASCAG